MGCLLASYGGVVGTSGHKVRPAPCPPRAQGPLPWGGPSHLILAPSALGRHRRCSGMPQADYQKIEVVGEGTFGVVTRARVLKTGQVVAIKKIRSRASRKGADLATLRETMLLQELRHEHVIELREAYTHNGALSLVFEFCVTDLEKVRRERFGALTPVLFEVHAAPVHNLAAHGARSRPSF